MKNLYNEEQKKNLIVKNALEVTNEIKSQSLNPVKGFLFNNCYNNSKQFLKHPNIPLTAITCEGINNETTYKGFEVS
jgi:hypothetical protein